MASPLSNDKTPLQAVVSVVCDALCELPLEDQRRALEAVAITLGIQPRPSSLPAAFPATRRNVVDAINQDLFTRWNGDTPAAARYRDGLAAGGSFQNGNGAAIEVRPLREERANLPERSPFVLRNQSRAAR
jgi:hypothetical protein